MNINEIKPYTKNAKKHPQKQIDLVAKSIKEYGFNQPIVIDKDNEIIVGHARYEAAKQLELKDVPVIKLENLTPQQVKGYRLMDNKSNESDWAMELVIEELKELNAEGFDIDLTGFDKDLIIEPNAKDDVIPDSAPKRAKLGDVWQLGRHRVMCGDSTSKKAVEKLMGGVLADMVFTDPPYNVDYKGMQNSKQWDSIANDMMPPDKFESFLIKSFQNLFDFSSDKSGCYICHADKSHKEFRNAFEYVGFEWRATIIWEKNSPAFNFAQYKYKHEPIFYCYKKGKVVNWWGDRTQNTIWKADKERGDHPTIKPVELIIKALFNSSKAGSIVLDTFLGSGSTLIACEKTNRICYGMELDPKYVDVIIQRYEDYTGNKATKIS